MDNMYVIKRNSDGCYVTYSGCSSSYTKNLGTKLGCFATTRLL